MTTALRSSDQYAAWVGAPAAAVYFESPACGVCQVLRPKVEALFAARFPQVPLARLDAAAVPEAAAQAGVFAYPTLVVFFDGRVFLRKSRSFTPGEVEQALERHYALWGLWRGEGA